MSLVIYDTLRRDEVAFEPREDGRASIYVCGPTVQSGPHVGHGRGQVVFDVLRRWLGRSGYDVRFVCNVTDVEDKIIIRAKGEGVPAPVIAQRYTREWDQVMDALGVLPPDVQPRATGHIIEMQQLITTLIEADKAYVRDGNVLFRVRRFEGYGKLSNRQVDDMQQGDDVVGADAKDDPLDFAMWKAAKPDEPSWPSPWGDGRPGWHIECSAMALRHLGHEFDIHGGGLDLVFPHHENELAQYEAAHGAPFARYWMHNGMIAMGADKMSKSIGNVVSLRDAVAAWGRGPLRLWYLSAHHRSPLVYDEERLEDARAGYERFLTFLLQAALALGYEAAGEIDPDHAVAAPHAAEFAEALDADLNAPRAIAALHDLVTAGHELLERVDAGDDDARPGLRALGDTLADLADQVLGLDLEDAAFSAYRVRERYGDLIDDALTARAEARADKDWERADAIRDRLAAAGIVVEDRPERSRWYADPLHPHDRSRAALERVTS
ncbi:MAG: cysteine--tRNA ligase [Actinobacteria bacterium]|nr:cysteine--tRNA ligase [Actinomycetota bacterium]